MSLPRLALGLLGASSALSLVALSGAAFTSESSSQGRLGASPDWTAPTVAVTGATGLVRGTVAVNATATDADSAVREVRLEVRPAGSAGAWTPICTTTTSPYSCSWSTTGVVDGRYELRAVATDVHSNVATSAVVTRTVDNQGPVVSIDEDALPEYARGTITVSALATDAGGVASVTLQRSSTGTGGWSDLCTDTTAPYSCSLTTTGSGEVFLRAVAVDVAGTSTTSAVTSVILDNTAPAVSISNPGGVLAGTVTVSAAASDADSGVASVAIEYRASSTSPWVPICTDVTAPYSCRWDTTQVADGTTYAFRAIATDNVGFVTTTAATANNTVDNRTSSVSLEDPGTYLRGTVNLLANANAPAGVASVTIQYAPTGSSTWTTVCIDTTAPYSCAWDTTKVAAGSYSLRAIMTPVTGSTVTSALVTGRIVDNAPLRGVDIQSVNGGVLGKVDQGDTVSYTFDSLVNLDSIAAGWTGSARTVTARFRDGKLTGGGSSDDVIDVFTTSGLTTPVALGTVNIRGDYIKGGKTVLFTATLTAETVTVNGQSATRVHVRLDALASADERRSFSSTKAMIWTPSAAARDLAGNSASTTPVDETGTLDRDF